MALNLIDDDYINSIIKSSGPYNPLLNKTQGVKLRELIKLLRDQIQQGSGAVPFHPIAGDGITLTGNYPDITFTSIAQSSPEPVTYAGLMNLVNGNLLVPAKQYLITDFASRFSKYSLVKNATTGENTFNIDYSVASRYSGPVEPIVVIAKTTNAILDRAYSTFYPTHVLSYTLNNIATGVTASDKGTILRRVDLVRNVNINFDFMAMKCFTEYNGANPERLAILIEKCTNFYGNFVGHYGNTSPCYIMDVLSNSRYESNEFAFGTALLSITNSTIVTTNSIISTPQLRLVNCKIYSNLNLNKTTGTITALSVNGNKNGIGNKYYMLTDENIGPFLGDYLFDYEKTIYYSSTGVNYLRTIGPDGNYVITAFAP